MSQDLSALFAILADLTPAQRGWYFTENSVDEATRRELEELLAHDSGDAEPFSQLVGAAATAVFRGDAIGTRCGAFRLVRVLGAGGMGVVYLAQRADGEVVQQAAIKLMQPGWSPVQRDLFLREREILAALTHPNIAHLLDAGHLRDGQPYLAMEYVEGKKIDEYCRGFSVQRKIELFLKICGAVEYLHANSVLHRDLKPGNILVTALGEPKLLDFGIAKMLDIQSEVTVTQMRMLTPDYASPEQLRGGPVGPASDVYSLGAVLWTLLTGKPASEMERTEVPAGVKSDLKQVLQTAVQPDPQDRYSSVAEFSQDLRAYLESRPVRAAGRGWFYRTGKYIRRQPVTAFLGGALLIALAATGTLFYKQSRSAPVHQDLRPKRLTANTPDLPIEAAAISPDGRTIAYNDPLGIHLQNPDSGATRLIPGTAGHVLLRWMSDGSGFETRTVDESGNAAATVVTVDGSVRGRATAESGEFELSPNGRHRARIAFGPERIIVEDAKGEGSRVIWSAEKRFVDEYLWSPDSTQLAVVSSGALGYSLEIVQIGSRAVRTLIAPSKDVVVGGMAWPDQNRIILALLEQGKGINSQGTSNLWELRLRESGPGALRRLTAWTDFPIRAGSLSSDGKKLTFIRSFRQRDVYVAEFDAARRKLGSIHRLTQDLGDDYPTAWTPDSKTVLFTSDRNGPSEIFRQDIQKQTADQLVFGPETQIIARTTPDKKWILFYGREGDRRGVMRAPLEGGGKAEFLFEVSGIMGLRCSRVGPCIVAERKERAVVVTGLDPAKGTKGREIYRDTVAKNTGPDLSPDAKWLATPVGTKIVLRSFASGTVVREILIPGATNAMNLANLDYAPDGKGFFAGQITPAGTRQLYVDLSGKVSVLWRQAGKTPVWAVPSPDGKYLAMMVYTDDSNVYAMNNF